MTKLQKTVLLVLILLIILFLGYCKPARAEAPIMTEIEAKTLKTVDWLTKLANCESGGKWTALNPSDGGSRSVGLLQFKDSTWKYYNERYKLGFTKEDIWNGDKQIKMATNIIMENKNNQNQWYNCSKVAGRL